MDSIIFDLDGTLWDATESVVIVWNQTIRSSFPKVDKVISLDDMQSVMGLVVNEIGRIFFPSLSEEESSEIIRACCRAERDYLSVHGAKPYEFIEDVLKELSLNYQLYIVSNCQDGYIEAFFNAHQLEHYFSDYECAGRTSLTKGENIQEIIRRNGLKNAVYVGDTLGDLKAAYEAGVVFIYANYGFGQVKEFDAEIDHIHELPFVMEQLEEKTKKLFL